MKRLHVAVLLPVSAVLLLVIALADQIELTNGDRYHGKVLSLDEKKVKFQSEVQGIIQLPRDKVNRISLGDAPPPLLKPSSNSPALRAAPSNILHHIRTEGIDPKLLDQVQSELLGEASPEALRLYSEMLKSLRAGTLDVNGIRLQAQNALKDLDDLKEYLNDPDMASLIESYREILQNFLQNPEIAPPPAKAPAKPKGK